MRIRTAVRLAWLTALCIGACAAAAPAATASTVTIYVTPGSEDHAEGEEKTQFCSALEREVKTSEECPIRAALEEADTLGFALGVTEVVVVVPPGHYVLTKEAALPLGATGGKTCVTKACDITLRGAGAGKTVIAGGHNYGQIAIPEGATEANLAVEDLTLTEGVHGITAYSKQAPLTVRRVAIEHETTPGLGGGGAIGAHQSAPVTIYDSAMTGDWAPAGIGGAVYAWKSIVTIVRSTLSGDRADEGGAIYAAIPSSSVQLIDSTLAGNIADHYGGALAGGMFAIEHSTLAGNSAASGGAIWNSGGGSITGSILASNSPDACAFTVPNTLLTGGANVLFGLAGNCTISGTQPITADPRLAPLANNGGFGQTMGLLAGSSAFNAAGVTCPAAGHGTDPALDERGVPRPQGAECDIGAFESRADASVTIAASPEPAAAGSTLLLTASARNAGPEPLTGVAVNIPLPAGTAVVAAPAGCSAAFGPGGSFTCQLGSLAPGETRAVTVQVRPEHPGALIETATVSAEQPDVKPSDNTATIASVVTTPGGPKGGSVAGSALATRTIRFDRRGNATVAISCPAGAPGGCRDAIDVLTTRGTLPATATARRATLLASAHATIPAGTTRRVRISLTTAGRRLLGRGRRASARALLTAAPGTGNGAQATSRANVTLTRGR